MMIASNSSTKENSTQELESQAVHPRAGGPDGFFVFDDDFSLTELEFEAVRLGAILEKIEVTSEADKRVVSTGFITLPLKSNKAKTEVFTASEVYRVQAFRNYREKLADKRVIVQNLADGKVAKLVKPADASRYFFAGRKRIKARIRKRLGRWYNCPGVLLSLTFDPELYSREDAWRAVGWLVSGYVNEVNQWRKRRGMPKAKFIGVLEPQPGTGYPHVHLVFPYLKWLAPIAVLTELWGQASNSVDVKVKDQMSPVGYVCKYITKLDGWSDLALSYIWANGTRLYRMSRDYSLPDYSDKRVPEWQFRRCLSLAGALYLVRTDLGGYETLLGAEDLVAQILERGSS